MCGLHGFRCARPRLSEGYGFSTGMWSSPRKGPWCSDRTRTSGNASPGRSPHEPLVLVLHREVQALVRHRAGDGAAPIWRTVHASPALREYEESMRLRHAESPATAIADDLDLPRTTTACRAIARSVTDAHALARDAADPENAVDDVLG